MQLHFAAITRSPILSPFFLFPPFDHAYYHKQYLSVFAAAPRIPIFVIHVQSIHGPAPNPTAVATPPEGGGFRAKGDQVVTSNDS